MGGLEKCAAYCYTDVAAIARWLLAESVPNGWQFRLHWRLAQLGYAVDPVALEWVSPDAMQKSPASPRRTMARRNASTR